MDLNEEQKQTVKSWIEAGDGLAEVQEKIQEEFNLSLTYMDVRFLVDDLGAELQDTSSGAPESGPERDATIEAEDADLEMVDENDQPIPFSGETAGADEAGAAAGGVSVDVDKVQRPGAVVSGSVTFTDGTHANWQIDQLGRLGIIPPREGYQPPEEDLQAFQAELQKVLQKQGF